MAVALTGAVIPARASVIRPARASFRATARPAFNARLKRASLVQTVRVRAEAAAGTSAGALATLLSDKIYF